MRKAFQESAFRMVTDQQIRRLYKLSNIEETQAIAAAKAGMDVKTARRYLRARRLPSEMKTERYWRTRQDGFAEVWPEIREQLRTGDNGYAPPSCANPKDHNAAGSDRRSGERYRNGGKSKPHSGWNHRNPSIPNFRASRGLMLCKPENHEQRATKNLYRLLTIIYNPAHEIAGFDTRMAVLQQDERSRDCSGHRNPRIGAAAF